MHVAYRERDCRKPRGRHHLRVEAINDKYDWRPTRSAYEVMLMTVQILAESKGKQKYFFIETAEDRGYYEGIPYVSLWFYRCSALASHTVLYIRTVRVVDFGRIPGLPATILPPPGLRYDGLYSKISRITV